MKLFKFRTFLSNFLETKVSFDICYSAEDTKGNIRKNR